jgi:hypothetical protein
LERYHRGDSFWGLNKSLQISLRSLIPKNLHLGPQNGPQKLKTAKNSKLPKLPENCFEPVGKGGWPLISTWITPLLKIRSILLLSLHETLLGCISEMPGNLTNLATVHSIMGNDWINMNKSLTGFALSRQLKCISGKTRLSRDFNQMVY